MGRAVIDETQLALFSADGDDELRIQIASEIERLKRFDIAVFSFAHPPQDGLGVCATPDGSKPAWSADPSGNILSFPEARSA